MQYLERTGDISPICKTESVQIASQWKIILSPAFVYSAYLFNIYVPTLWGKTSILNKAVKYDFYILTYTDIIYSHNNLLCFYLWLGPKIISSYFSKYQEWQEWFDYQFNTPFEVCTFYPLVWISGA